jgi:hypothetical protein
MNSGNFWEHLFLFPKYPHKRSTIFSQEIEYWNLCEGNIVKGKTIVALYFLVFCKNSHANKGKDQSNG